jgi:hypothetical protein
MDLNGYFLAQRWSPLPYLLMSVLGIYGGTKACEAYKRDELFGYCACQVFIVVIKYLS